MVIKKITNNLSSFNLLGQKFNNQELLFKDEHIKYCQKKVVDCLFRLFKKNNILKLTGCLVLIIIILFAFLGIIPQMEKETDLKSINSQGKSGNVLVIYHPGLSSFQEDVTYSFVKGLVERDYAIEITTSSSKTTTDISKYDLIVLGMPTYGGGLAKPMENYLARIDDLEGKKVVIIITGAGSTDESVTNMKEFIAMRNGYIIESLPLWSMKPNEDVYGINDATEIAYNSALNLQLS